MKYQKILAALDNSPLGSVSNYIVHHAPSSILVVQETKHN